MLIGGVKNVIMDVINVQGLVLRIVLNVHFSDNMEFAQLIVFQLVKIVVQVRIQKIVLIVNIIIIKIQMVNVH